MVLLIMIKETNRWWVLYVFRKDQGKVNLALEAYSTKNEAAKDCLELIRMLQTKIGGTVNAHKTFVIIQEDEGRHDHAKEVVDGYDLVDIDSNSLLAVARVSPVRLMR